MVSYELEDFPSLLEKMPIAFFRMSRSMRISSSSRLSRAISFSSSVRPTLPLPGKLVSGREANSAR
jgi:hypothetical protein